VLVRGLTTADPPEKLYVLAPVGFKVKLFPVQSVPLFTLMVGREATVTVEVAVLADTQPAVLDPDTR
jgi:hypothetical protein